MQDKRALLERAIGRDVVSVECRVLDLGSAFGDLERWIPTYADGGADAPASVIAKTPKSGEIRQLGDGLGLYQRESRFYAELAATLPLRTPRCWEPGLGGGTMLLEDLADLEPGDQVAGLSVERAKQMLAEAAGMHAAWWGRADQDWLFAFDHPVNIAMLSRAAASGVATLRERFEGLVPTAVLEAAASVPDRLGQILGSCATGPLTLVHGDMRPDNVLFDGDETVYLDWQIVARGRATHDAAYLLSSSLPVEVLAEHWESLLRGFHGCLVDLGVDYSWDDCVAHYRQNVLFSIVPALATLGAMSVVGERGAELSRVIGERAMSHAADVDAFATQD